MKRALGYRHLEVFRAIMQAGSVTGAGVLLGASQPAVSRLLAQTEDLAGFPLFERVRGRLVPTAMAQTLYEEADRIFTGLEEVAALAERLRTGAPRRVVIACLPTLTVTVLPQAVAAWRASGRQESLSVHSRAADGVMGLVSMRQADLGIGINVPAVPGCGPPCCCAARPGASWHRSIVWRRSRWCARPTCMARPSSPSREEGRQALVDAALRDSGARPIETVECRLAAGAVAMAAAGVGVTIADAFSVSLFLHQGLVLRRFEPAIAFDYRLIWPAGAPDTFGRAALAQHIRDAVQDLVRRVAPGP
ncbi:LysR substrate-binding domain-containing protein [Pseudoroseomonas wenyumeiae]